MPDFSMFLPLTALLIALFGLILSVGGILVYRGSRNKGLSNVQESTITALQAQNEAQESQMQMQDKHIAMLEKKIDRLEAIFSTLQLTLEKRRGLLIEVNDDLITIIDKRAGTEQTVKIKIDSGELTAIKKEEA